ncbi:MULTISPECIES: TipJ family phage tail tip protein [Acinetobacter calcoaceticus/baumannii complex]|uniref:host specificity protein J n=1 Tax=Acinetobacter calcoaceticus/baumannii complex TaxID=909768 RepID=UPI00044EDF9B|nr:MULTISPECIES: phage tail protein [Acinetobacter calcoaceticus/baumannii complex]EXF00237.1 phage tail family protein [Acinetobacter sp. 259052]EYT19499.1 phage tail family protein [Acinetobacter sp. 1592897]KRJ14071.1 phage tail protein [Acinetobacter nosocomialis]OUR09201.1 phage tail protein [Acinetobacter nosocomialis]
MNAVVGAKKGSNKQRQPVISPDSAQSKTFIKVLYGLAEGEIEGLANGLQSIYLEETQLQNADGSLNFENVKVDFRSGTNDQEYIEGFPAVESETAIDVELKSETPWVRAFSNLDLDAVRLRLKWGPLRTQNATNGDVSGVTIEYAIDLQTDGGIWTEVLKTKISDKTSANYERAHRIDLPQADSGWLIRVRRLTPNSMSEYVSDKMYIEAVTEVIDAKLCYPNTALLGLQYDAETFGNVAKVAADTKGKILKVPTNYNPATRQYVGMWDGTFKEAYSNNPAWIYYDICTVDRYALGDRLTPLMVDKWSLYRLAQYCDQMVPNGLGGQEPRFTCNVYLQSAEGAFEILTKLAGVFRAITFWDGNSIICDADIPQDTYFTYTRANVIEGNFEYAGTRARDRHNVVKVAWDNPANHYKTEYEFVRDEKAITEAGQVRILEIDAWGCTSRGQAQRAGWWALKSEQLETRTVSFKVGLDGHIPQPGRVIDIADPLFAGRANGGRVSKISADRKSITLDRDDVVAVAGDRLIINGEDGKAQTRIVQSISGRVVTVTHEFDAIAVQNVWVMDAQDLATMKFRVISITQDEHHQFSVTALQYNPAKFDAIDKGAYFDEVPISIVNPTIQDTVTDVVITSESRVDQGINVATMIVSWAQAKGAVKYQVEWRKDDGSWIKLPITGNNSVEVPGIYAGQYQARVTAISAFEIASLPVYSTLTELSGKQGLPPKPAFIQATGILFGIKLNWGFPSTGALDTAYTEIEVSPDGTSNIAQLGLFAYPTTTHAIQGLQSNLTQFYRGRLIDRIGNIGPWSDWTHATTSADATDVLELLNDQISESQLNQDLKTKIDHIETIDAEIGPIKQDIQNTKDRIAQEVIDRQNAIQQAKDGLSQQIIDGDEGVLKVVNTVKQSSDDGLAAAQESIRVVANDLSLVAEKTDGVYAQLNPPLIGSESDLIGNDQGFAGTWSVQSAMIEGDLALSKRIDTTAVELNNLQAYAQREVQARIEGDRVTVQKIDNYIASNDSALATVRQSAQVAVEQSSANAEAIDLINLELDDKASTGQLTQVKSDIKNVDDKVAAQTVRIDGVFAQLNPPLIGSESDLIGNEGGYAGVWSEQSARIEGDLAQSKRTDQVSAQMNESNALFQQQINANASAISSTIKVTETLQTKVGKNSSSIQNVSESVDGIYAQQFIKFDVNGHVSGHGSMNDGTTSTFIFNYDRIQFGTPVGIDGIEPKPLMTLQNKPVTLPNGTVIPRGLYVDNGSFGYINANRIWAENLSVISADLGTIKVKTANIEDGAIDTLKIKDEAVTVPIGVKAIDIKTINTFSGGSTGGLPNNDFSNHLSAWEEHIGTLLQVTLNRSGGKVRLDASVNICTPSFGAFSVGDGRGKPIAANDRAMASFYISIYRNGSLIGRGSLGANIETGNINVNFNGTAVIVSAIDDISTVGNVTYTLKAGFARQEGVNIPLNVSSNNTFMITSRTLSVIEMKK